MEQQVLNEQVGGGHYKNMPFQPVMLFAKTHCTAFQANIWKYISRYKFKNGHEDIKKCMHYAQLAKELKCYGRLSPNYTKLLRAFCHTNGLSSRETRIVLSAAFDKYDQVIKDCEHILQDFPTAKDKFIARLKNFKTAPFVKKKFFISKRN